MINNRKTEYLYEDKYCAFIDILGFKNIVGTGQVKENAKKPSQIVKYLKVLKSFQSDLEKRNKKGYNAIGIEASYFSDSLVISYPKYSMAGNLFYLIMDIFYLSIELANQGIFLRGAITCGKLYHKDDLCFGPAFIESYMLEEKSAIYPRVILQDRLVKEAINIEVNHPMSTNNLNDAKKFYYATTKKDVDGFRYINFMGLPGEFDDADPYITMLENIKKTIKTVIKKEKNDNIKQKYHWLQSKMNEVISDKSLSIPVIDTSLSREYWRRIKKLKK